MKVASASYKAPARLAIPSNGKAKVAEEDTDTSSIPDPPIRKRVSFAPCEPIEAREVQLIRQSWAVVIRLGADSLGWMLFTNLFKIDPYVETLFAFHVIGSTTMTTRMSSHAAKVIGILDTVISRLHDPDVLGPMLREIGLKHVGYGMQPEHLESMELALSRCLHTILGEKATTEVTDAWESMWESVLRKHLIGTIRLPRLRSKAERKASFAERAKLKAEAKSEMEESSSPSASQLMAMEDSDTCFLAYDMD